MIKIIENDIFRGREKIGYIRGNDIFNVGGKKIGYYVGDEIYNYKGAKIGYLENNHIKYENGNRKISFQETKNHISGGTIPDICRVAIRLLFGD
ncbi:MAG: 4-fold beta flower protein [Patescibacteria group bacterium]